LLAGVAGFAGTANATGTTNVTPVNTLQAPLVNSSPTFAAGFNARFTFTVTAGTAADSDGLELFALFYNSSNTYVGLARAGATTTTNNAGGATKTLTVALTAPGSATQVVFIALPRGDEGAANSADDTFATIAANRAALVIVPTGTTRTSATASFVDVGAGAAFGISAATGASAAQIDAIAQLGAINSAGNRQALSTTYTGPALISATKAATATPLDARVTFNAALAALSDNANVTTTVRPQSGVTNSAATSVLVKGALSAGGTSFRIDDNSTALANSPDNIDILAGSTNVTDEAGNAAAAVSNFTPVSVYAAPAFAAAGTAKVTLDNAGTAVNQAGEVTELYSTTGTGNNGETFVLNARMAEAFDGTGLNNVDDIVLTPAAVDAITTITASGANASTFGVTITLGAEAQAIRVSPTTGQLEFTADDTLGANVVWTPITLGLTVGASAATTADGGALTVANTPVNAFSAVAPAAPTVGTRDANVDGILDGVTLTFATDVTNVNATGFSIFDRDIPATNPSAVTVAAGTTATVVNVNGTQATIVGYLTGAETTASVLNTGNTSTTPIPYDFSLTNATVTYARVYNATTGNLQTVSNVAAAGTISDGAGPALLSVTRALGEANDPEGTLTLRFSETMLGGAVTSTVSSTPGGTLFGQILSLVDDGGAASTGALVTFTGSTITDDSLQFSDVDNDVLSSLTATGVGAANASVGIGSAIRDANANRAGVQSVAPAAATVVTNIAPTADRAVAVVDANQNITNILVFLTKNVTLTGTNLQNQFTFSINGGTVAPTTATVTGNIVNLALTGGGLPLAQVQLGATDTVSYTNGGPTVLLADANNNALATFGPLDIDLPASSANLFTMDIRGNVKTTGSTNVAQGTIVRADLMRFAATRVVDRGSVKVPCINCSSSVSDVAITTFTNIDTIINNGAVLGDATVNAYVVVTADQDGRKSAVLQDTPGAAGAAVTIYNVSINRTSGAITSTGGSVTGQLVFRNGPISYTAIESARYAVVNGTDGNFRINVGTNNSFADAFVIVSVRQNGSSTSSWVPVTFADPSLAGYLPFNQDVRVTTTAGQSDSPFIDFESVGGGNGTVTANFVLSNVRSIDLADSVNYQLVGLPGQITRNATALNDFRAFRFFATVNTTTGAPYALWSFGGNNTEAFTLVGNSVRSSFSLGNVNVENIRNSAGSMFGVAYRDVGNTVVVSDRDTLFYPQTAANATDINAPAGWHLITVQADQASPGFLGNTTTDNTAVGMIIEAGARRNGDGAGSVLTQARTWIRGATNNSLTSLVAGRAYFVYLSAADSAFTGR
jgi:hypothetical protein